MVEGIELKGVLRSAGLAGLVLAAAWLAGCGGGGSDAAGETAPPAVTAPAVTTQPSSVTVAPGSTATFSVVVSGSGVAYEWQRSTTGGVSWQAIDGASQSSVNIGAVDASMNGHQFRVAAQNVAGSVVSNPATLTVSGAGGGGVNGVTTTAVAAGYFHSLALRADATVLA